MACHALLLPTDFARTLLPAVVAGTTVYSCSGCSYQWQARHRCSIAECATAVMLTSMGAEAWIEPEHVMISVNWPTQRGCIADICSRDQQESTEPLVCERGSMVELCELLLQCPNSLQVCTLHCSALCIAAYFAYRLQNSNFAHFAVLLLCYN